VANLRVSLVAFGGLDQVIAGTGCAIQSAREPSMICGTFGRETSAERIKRISTNALRGAGASLGASLVMGSLLLGAKHLGLLGEPPPQKLTRKILGLRRSQPATLSGSTFAAHLGYGAGAGALFGALAAPIERPRDRALAGSVFGAALWAVSYAGWIPAAGLMPVPQFDRPGRPTVMFLAHLVFGAVLGRLYRPRERAQLAPDPELNESDALDRDLADSFPASDPPAATQPRSHR